MLSCPSKMIKPLTFATTKNKSALGCNSILRMPLGCSCYYTKNFVLLHVVKNKCFDHKDWDTAKPFFKEKKKFICTSVFFWKSKTEKVNSILNNLMKTTHDDKSKTSSQSINLNSKLTKASDNQTANTLDDGSDSKKKSAAPVEKNAETHSRNGTKDAQSVTTSSSDENTEMPKVNKEDKKKTDSGSNKLDKYVIENILLSEKKTKTPGVTGVTTFVGDISGAETKVLVKPVKKEPAKVSNLSEVPKHDGKNITNGELKRKAFELNLSEVNKDSELKEPPNICSVETGRSADEVTLLKDCPHKFLEKAKNILRKTSGSVKLDEIERIPKVIDLGEPKGNINISTTTRRRQTVDLNRSSTERNFITPVRALTDFLLKPSDLEGLRKTKRRSPYENDPPITVYWRKDVEAKALDVWGSKENLLKEILKRDIERRRYQQNLFTVKRRLRDYRREQGRESEIKLEQNGLFGSSGKVVLTAIAINGTNFVFKLTAWLYTGSHSMFSEAIHSLADTINQLILAYGIHKSVQRADSDHPYGYTNMRYVSSLISGVGIFCVGSGLSIYHGVVGLTDPSDIPSFYWAYFILGGSLASEGATLLVAFNSIWLGAKKSEMSFSEYVFRGQDPSVNVVLLEDAAAVIGVAFAGSCMGLSSYYGSHIPDAIGSFLVGGLLACVASFIIYTNVAALVGRSIPQERLDKINTELESDVMIRAIHDVKGIDIGNSLVRYKAEMDFDGGELTRSYLDKQDLNQMLEEVKKMQTIDELEEFMLKHGENIVDMMGGEIDRIELKLRKKHPEIRHCDLEIL